MADNRQSLLRELETARQELIDSQTRVAMLERRLNHGDEPVTTALNFELQQPSLDNLLEGCQIIGSDWRYLYVNREAARQGGKTPAEMIGYTVMECYPGVEASPLFGVLRQCMADKQPVTLDSEFIFPDGRAAWFELHVQPTSNGIFILSIDITARKNQELALQRYTNRLKILHQLDLGIIGADSVQQIIQLALLNIRKLFECQQARIILFDQANNELIVFAGDSEAPTALSEGRRYPMPPNTIEMFTASPLRVLDDFELVDDANSLYTQVRQEGMRSGLRALIRLNDHPFGLMSLNSNKPNYFTVEHQEVASELVNQLAIAIRQLELSTALNKSEQRYRSVVEDQTDLICRYKADLTIVFANQAYGEAVGLAPEAMIGKNLKNVIAPAALENFLTHARQVMASEGVVMRESPYTYPDGTQHWIQWQARALKDEHGQFVEYQSVGRDVTERRNTEHELKALYNATTYLLKADNLLSLGNQIVDAVIQEFAHVHCGLLLVEMEHNNLVLLAQKGEASQPDELSMLDAQGLIQRAIHTGEMVYAPDLDHQPKSAAAGDTVRSELVIPLKTARGVVAALDLKHNSVNAFSERDQRILITYAERAAAALETMQLYDVLDRYTVHLEQRVADRTEELQSAKDRVEAILNNSPNAILLITRDLHIQQANSSFYKMFEYRLDNTFGKSVLELAHFDHAELLKQACYNTQVEGQSTSLEVHAQRSDGSLFDADVSIALIKGDGYVCTFRDVTERNARERQLRYSASVQKSIRDAVIVTDNTFRIQSWNTAAELIYGWSAEEVIGQTTNFLHTVYESEAERKKVLQSLINSGAWQGEIVQYRKDRTAINVMASINQVKDEQGAVFGIVAVNRDITERKRAESALRDSEERFRQYFELPLIGMAITSLEKGWLQVNDKLCDMLGYAREELIQKTWEEITHPDDVAADVALYEDLIGGKIEGYSLDKRFIRKDRRLIYVTITIRAVRRTDGQINYFVGLLQDITESKQAEAALRESETRYRLLADNATDMVLRLNMEGEVDYVSPSIKSMLGYQPADILGQSAATFVHPDDVTTLLHMLDIGRSGRALSDAVLYRVRHKQGHYVWLESIGQVIYSQETGQPEAILGSSRDVSDRMRAEEALRESEERFRSIVNGIQDYAIFMLDPDGRVLSWSPGAERIKGYAGGEIIGKHFSQFYTPEDRANGEPQRVLGLAISTGHFADEGWRVRKDGNRFWANVEISTMRNQEGKLIGFTKVVSDVTERKKAEVALQQALVKEKELSELKSRFVSMASHEFRTPLATMLTITESLLHYWERMKPEQIGQRLVRIQEQISYLTEIMDDVLQLARLQARRAEYNPAPLDLAMVCQQVIDEFLSRSELAHNIVFNCNQTLPLLRLDHKVMRQILNNLIANAVKYSANGTTVTVNLQRTDDAIILRITDEGMGIPTADLDHLFEPFHRASNVGTIAGTGLGLTITKESVELHGGSIAIDSRVGIGTTFTITLPTTLEV